MFKKQTLVLDFSIYHPYYMYRRDELSDKSYERILVYILCVDIRVTQNLQFKKNLLKKIKVFDKKCLVLSKNRGIFLFFWKFSKNTDF